MNDLTSRIVLSETALCAIVRDEIMNPAGGIGDFIDSTVPFVEEAIVVDALSTDGTRQALEELQQKYSHLKVFDRKFTDYADQRNYSLDQTTAKRALVLDADERLTHQDFVQLKQVMERKPVWGYMFGFWDISPNFPKGRIGDGHCLRFFERWPNVRYRGEVWEHLYLADRNIVSGENSGTGVMVVHSDIEIKHFRPGVFAISAKKKDWYNEVVRNGKAPEVSPSTVESFSLWKAYNPARENFR